MGADKEFYHKLEKKWKEWEKDHYYYTLKEYAKKEKKEI